jgi:hypothetical protein
MLEMTTLTFLQNLSTGISLVILSAGFSLLGILSYLNRPQANVASHSLDTSCCLVGSSLSLVTGAVFLGAAWLYWNRYTRMHAV